MGKQGNGKGEGERSREQKRAGRNHGAGNPWPPASAFCFAYLCQRILLTTWAWGVGALMTLAQQKQAQRVEVTNPRSHSWEGRPGT